jgi:hypothetical protein
MNSEGNLVSISSNILRTNFLYERCFGSFFLVTCTLCVRRLYEKTRAHKVDEIDGCKAFLCELFYYFNEK